MKTNFKNAVIASLACIMFACNVNDSQEVILPEVVPVEEEQETPSKPDDTLPVLDNVPLAKPIELTTYQKERVSADNRIAFKLFREIAEISKEPNTFFSPMSLNLAMGMLYNGAAGETRAEMAEVLGIADLSDTEINEYHQTIMQTLSEIDPLSIMNFANSIWYRNSFDVKSSFLDVNKTYFNALVEALDFSKPDAADIINQWCAEQTKDKIKEIIEGPIDGDVMMYLINTLYFRSNWEKRFMSEFTINGDFTKSDNTKIKANLMGQTDFFRYYEDRYLQYVELPYGNRAFSMSILLGANDMDNDKLIEYLDESTWQNILDNAIFHEISLKLPRFKIEYEMMLNQPVENIGMKQIFDEYHANFLGILIPVGNRKLFVSNIKQKTFIQVDENGSEAAAVTAIEMDVTCDIGPTPPPIPFTANRPFLYLIKENSTGSILFIGRLDEPQE